MLRFHFGPFAHGSGVVRGIADAAAFGLPVLGSIPEFEPRPGARLPGAEYPGALEAYSRLTDVVRAPEFHLRGRVIVVTSALARAGKSTTAKNLATLLARNGSKVILVDADINRVARRRPGDGTSSSGFAGLLVNQLMRPDNALVHTMDTKLKLLPAGSVAGSADTLLQATRLPRVVETLRELADYVVFDVMAMNQDLTTLTRQADVTLLVLRSGATARNQARQAIGLLRPDNTGLLGIVLNRAPEALTVPEPAAKREPEATASPVEEAAELPGVPAQRLEIAVDDLLAEIEGAVKLLRSIGPAGRAGDADSADADVATRRSI